MSSCSSLTELFYPDSWPMGSSSAKHQMKRVVDPSMDSSTLLHVYHAVSHSFRGLACEKKLFPFPFFPFLFYQFPPLFPFLFFSFFFFFFFGDNIQRRYCNAVYNQNIIDRGTKDCIFPLPRKGDPKIAKNKRGITLTSIAAKIYHALLRTENWENS